MGGKTRRVAIVVFTLAFAAALALMASCAQSQVKSDEGSKGASSDSSEGVSAESASAASAQAGNLAKWIVDYNETIGAGNAVEAPNALAVQAGRTAQIPEVRIAEDGTMYQRTPSEYEESKEFGYVTPEDQAGSYAYNIRALDADNRGCIACHEDLGKTCNNIGYTHFDLTNDRGIEITVDMCLDCHVYQPLSTMESDYYNFKELMHGIHSPSSGFEGNCMSCHVQVGDDPTMYLWDKKKYDMLRGVVDLDKLDGTFKWSQGEEFSRDEWFDFNWLYTDYDLERKQKELSGEETDPEVQKNWTITISGAVDKEMTFKLQDLIDQGLGEEHLVVANCTMNPQGGPFAGNFRIKGIPLDPLFEQAGVSKDAIGFYPLCSDGYYGYMNLLKDYHGGYLVYEIDGQPLSWVEGYPVVYWQKGGCAGNNTKAVTDFIFDTKLPEESLDTNGNLTELGWEAADAGKAKDKPEYFTAKPQIGVYDNISGKVVEVGEPYTFTGYAYGFDEDIASIEISMDNGATWTSFETPDPDPSLLVDWSYTFTPEVRGSYLLMVDSSRANKGEACGDPMQARGASHRRVLRGKPHRKLRGKACGSNMRTGYTRADPTQTHYRFRCRFRISSRRLDKRRFGMGARAESAQVGAFTTWDPVPVVPKRWLHNFARVD